MPKLLSNKLGVIHTSEAWDALSGQVNSNTSGLIETALANNADMQRWRKENGERKAEILEVRTTLVDETQAFAEKLEHVSAKLGENEAAIETKATTVFKQNGDGQAIHSVKAGITHNDEYHSAGMAIGAEVKDGQVKTQVLFEADRLALLNRSNGQVTVPFVVQNGQVFINEAFIDQGTIERIVVGMDIRSKDYDPITKKGMRLDFQSKVMAIYNVKNGAGTEQDAEGFRAYYNGNWVVNMGRLFS